MYIVSTSTYVKKINLNLILTCNVYMYIVSRQGIDKLDSSFDLPFLLFSVN